MPDYQSLMLPVLLLASNGEVRIGAAVEELANKLGLTPEERSELLPSGKQTTFSKRLHWAKTYMAQAGLVENTRRRHFKITARGRQVLDMLAIIEKRGFLNACRPVSPRDRGKWIDPEAVSTADRALAHGRRLGSCRRSDRRRTMICHGRS